MPGERLDDALRAAEEQQGRGITTILTHLGENLTSRLRCLGHDPRKESELRQLGTTRFGTPVMFNRRVLDADVKILTGRIVPHYFAGYSGGRKAWFVNIGDAVVGIENMQRDRAERGLKIDSAWDDIRSWLIGTFGLKSLPEPDEGLAAPPNTLEKMSVPSEPRNFDRVTPPLTPYW